MHTLLSDTDTLWEGGLHRSRSPSGFLGITQIQALGVHLVIGNVGNHSPASGLLL